MTDATQQLTKVWPNGIPPTEYHLVPRVLELPRTALPAPQAKPAALAKRPPGRPAGKTKPRATPRRAGSATSAPSNAGSGGSSAEQVRRILATGPATAAEVEAALEKPVSNIHVTLSQVGARKVGTNAEGLNLYGLPAVNGEATTP
jgi:hypothetical protein